GFEHQADAERFQAELRDRLAQFALTLHPDKTRLIQFGRRVVEGRGRGRAWQAGDVRLLGLHPYLRSVTARQVSALSADPTRPQTEPGEGSQGGAPASDARSAPQPGTVAATGGDRLFCLSRCSDQLRRPS